MNENDDLNNSIDSISFKSSINRIEEVNLNKEDVEIYRQIIENNKYFYIHFTRRSKRIKISYTSFLKLLSLNELYPEENVLFIYYNKYTASISSSSLSITGNNTIKLKKVEYGESTTNLITPNKYFYNSLNDTINKEIWAIQKRKNFFIYYLSFLYYFYLIVSSILFFHFLFILSKKEIKYNYVYFMNSIFLVLTMGVLGFIGVSKEWMYNNDNDFFFWFNFIVFIFTFTTFISFLNVINSLIYNEKNKIISIIILCLYIVSLVVEIFVLLFFDYSPIIKRKICDTYTEMQDEEQELLVPY